MKTKRNNSASLIAFLLFLGLSQAFIPIFHEVATAFQSLGDAITGNPEKARERWQTYAEESIIGSGIYAAVEAAKGNTDRAEEIAKGMGRATGQVLTGGGLLGDIPVFHELQTAGKSLGDMIGGGDHESARNRWKDYAEESVIGSGIYAAVEAANGNLERAEELAKGMGKATAKAAVEAAVVGGAIATGGVAGVIVGGLGSVVENVVDSLVDGKEIDPGNLVGGGLLGGIAGGVGGKIAKNKHANVFNKAEKKFAKSVDPTICTRAAEAYQKQLGKISYSSPKRFPDNLEILMKEQNHIGISIKGINGDHAFWVVPSGSGQVSVVQAWAGEYSFTKFPPKSYSEMAQNLNKLVDGTPVSLDLASTMFGDSVANLVAGKTPQISSFGYAKPSTVQVQTLLSSLPLFEQDDELA